MTAARDCFCAVEEAETGALSVSLCGYTLKTLTELRLILRIQEMGSDMDKPLERVAVVGSGILRTQIAMMAAHAGYAVTVYDPREEAFTETYNKIKSDLTAKQAPPLIPWEEWEKCKAAVQRVTSLDGVYKDEGGSLR